MSKTNRTHTPPFKAQVAPESVRELERGLREYFAFHNERRIHQSLDYRTPAEVHQQESRRVQHG